MTPLLEVKNLNVHIPLRVGDLHAVRGVSFSVSGGETLCLVGESGCGKSLTSSAIMNLLPKQAQRTSEKLYFDNVDLTKLSEREMSDIRGNRMAMIFQDPMTSLNPTFTIGNQLEEVLMRHSRVSRFTARDKAVFLLEKVGIRGAGDRLKQHPHQLSGGLRQRVMIAMALMCDPKLIIADEPTTALDVTIQAEILNLLYELKQELGMALVLITHDLGVVASVADRVAVMYAGRVVETGSVSGIFQSPQHPYTQGLLSCVPIPGQTKRGEHLGSIPGVVPSLIGAMQGCEFANRCLFAQTVCRSGAVQLSESQPGHFYRCVFSNEERSAVSKIGARS
ncbi:ABC transporter ATP-binding protein [Pseudosulfitobacter sp. DSM 107133]|uniref:ABC transporter ATP-binding protein n=1 Tax=Pseudosulfitobacter sp. DSM 107133 TaxID=2883100 RepID=UPI000DF48108|nr:ABC transporter ATP-binding protein [Pseudosulfitobacter sp. DSM 107133]UOA29738.1 Oligopeptide transport ATP-binding protein OppD [Pseudosulfitobacter sp. DSM 107133]